MNRCPVSVVVIGVGNDLRADDAAGLEVARRLRQEPEITVKVHAGEAIDLLELWCDADAVVLVDTVRSGEATGTIHRFDATSNPVPLPLRGSSSHTTGVAEAIELARTTRRPGLRHRAADQQAQATLISSGARRLPAMGAGSAPASRQPCISPIPARPPPPSGTARSPNAGSST